MSSGERMKILEMLQEGKITATEAEALLKQFPDNSVNNNENWNYDANDDVYIHIDGQGRQTQMRVPPAPPKSSVGNVIDWARNLANDIAADIREGFDTGDIINVNGNFRGGKGSPFSFSAPVTANAINSIKLLGKNAPVKIETHEKNYILVQGKFKAKHREAEVIFNTENGDYELLYNYDSMMYVGITCYLPDEISMRLLHAETKNAAIDIDDISNVEEMVLMTRNGRISVDDAENIDKLTARTRNAAISLDDVSANKMEIVTTNSGITLDDVSAQTAELVTTNGRVTVEDIDITELSVRNTNGAIIFDDIFDGEWQGTRIISAETTNGNISIEIPKEIGVDILARSNRHSNVSCDLENMSIRGRISKDNLDCQSIGYENFERKVEMRLSTTNGSIKIREE
ncbi:MAG: DUF4097 domain-containing protein [Defluviitaleaceae bacterium]|nr:DUF4097 domain-containing protein [Defluviitaleaceae bacterium]